MRFRLTSSLTALRLYPWQDRKNPSLICSLPCQAVVTEEAESSIANGMIEVSWEGQRYAVFSQDLASKAHPETEEDDSA